MIEVLADAMVDPSVGDLAVLVDAERNRCIGTIRAIHGRLVKLKIEPDTWREPSETSDPPAEAAQRTSNIQSEHLDSPYSESNAVASRRELVPA